VTAVDVLVLGAGVIGLTTAVHLAEAGLRVEGRTAAPPESTTSAAAGAMWGPYLVEPRDRVLRWAHQTLDDLTRIAHDEPASGVHLASGIEASRREATLPEWAQLLPDVTPCRPEELPPGFAFGYRYTAPLVDMPRLPHLPAQTAAHSRRHPARPAGLIPRRSRRPGAGRRQLHRRCRPRPRR
jgi:D-amino-acid oxidase